VFLLFSITQYVIFSQENIITSIIEPLQKESLYREKIFIHFNKTIYFTDENIRFTAYVAEDNKNTPSNYTTNLHVNLLNTNGDIVDSKNLFIKNGVGYGDFLIDSQLNSGKYYIQGFTHYMQNFGKNRTKFRVKYELGESKIYSNEIEGNINNWNKKTPPTKNWVNIT